LYITVQNIEPANNIIALCSRLSWHPDSFNILCYIFLAAVTHYVSKFKMSPVLLHHSAR